MKKIKLTQGEYALVDDEDYDKFSKIKWYVFRACPTLNYAMCSKKQQNGKFRNFNMSREVMMNVPKGMVVDHIDGNGLNNQKKNLRIATTSQNGMNRKDNCNNTSGHRGVCYNKKNKKWQAQTMSMGKPVYLGMYDDILEAAKAYKEYAKKNYKQYRRIN